MGGSDHHQVPGGPWRHRGACGDPETDGYCAVYRPFQGPKRPDPTGPHAFNDFNTSKLGLTLNLKTPEGIDIAKRLITWADVYIESFTPGTVAGLGLSYDIVQAINPSVIMVSTCLMGQIGPAASFSGYGFSRWGGSGLL